MPPPKKKTRPPRHLEKMLLINHKEDQLLQDRLDQLHLKSRVREIELDRERINVRNELKESKKKQIAVGPNPLSRSQTNLSTRSPTEKPKSEDNEKKKDDNVNAYLLGEYRRMSEVIPSILLNLSAKDEAKQKMKSVSMGKLPITSKPDSDTWEPDLEKISKTVSSVKAIRHNLAINKKLENSRPTIPLAKVFKDIYAKEDHMDQYTDGACVLLKRKIEKRRRTSLSGGEPPAVMKRRHSSQEFTGVEPINTGISRSVSSPSHKKRHSVSLPSLPRIGSVLSPRSLSRCGTSLSAGARRKETSDKHTQFIDEDELLLQRRVANELFKYEKIKERVDSFLVYPKRMGVMYEEVLAIS